MPTKPKINVRLLRRIQKQIAKEPRQFDMDLFFYRSPSRIPNCGTACCIGGWAITLGDKFRSPEEARRSAGDMGYSHRASVILGLTGFEPYRLFHECNWPEPFRSKLEEALTPAKKAKIAIRRIDHFIKTKGRS